VGTSVSSTSRVLILAAAVGACGFTGASRDPRTDVDAPPQPPMTDAGADATPVDTGVDAYDFCPPSYEKHGDSYYRVIAAGAFSTIHSDCKNDAPGKTHAVVIDSSEEHDIVYGLANDTYWLGVVQRKDQDKSDKGWRALTDVSLEEWGWSESQPDDQDGQEDNQQNLAARGDNGVVDVRKNESYAGVCECDGYAVASNIEDDIP
jgi:hypothetical protein